MYWLGFENSGFGGQARGYNQYDPALNYGDSAFDARHRFVFSPIYNIPNWASAPGLGSLARRVTRRRRPRRRSWPLLLGARRGESIVDFVHQREER